MTKYMDTTGRYFHWKVGKYSDEPPTDLCDQVCQQDCQMSCQSTCEHTCQQSCQYECQSQQELPDLVELHAQEHVVPANKMKAEVKKWVDITNAMSTAPELLEVLSTEANPAAAKHYKDVVEPMLKEYGKTSPAYKSTRKRLPPPEPQDLPDTGSKDLLIMGGVFLFLLLALMALFLGTAHYLGYLS